MDMVYIIQRINQHPWTSLGVALIMLFGFQILNIIYGFDLYDTGFHLVAYQNIFDTPDCVSYNFVYYLTDIVGGGLLKLFPQMGVVGFRVVGALFILATIIFIFVTLKNEIPIIHLLLGSILVVVGYVRLPYAFKDGILSCCLYSVAIVILYKGLLRRSNVLIILGGIVVGINMFTRIPNILAVGLVVIVLSYNKFIFREHGSLNWKGAILFIVGAIIGVLVILLLMLLLGHIEIFKRGIAAIFSLAGGNSSHSLLWMMKIHFASYMTTIIPILVFYALIHIEGVVNKKCNLLHKYIFCIMRVLIVFLYVYETFYVYNIIFGLFALGCILCIMKRRDGIGLFAALALYMLIVEIYGSDWSVNHGSLPALLAAPVASMQLLNRKRIVYVVTFILAVCWQIIRKGNFQDVGPIYKKTEYIECSDARFILTTAKKANAINCTLDGIRPFVANGDTLMCFPAAPMMNYLTHTHPVGGMCWPGEQGFFVMPIEGCPKILFNKTSFSGENWYVINELDDTYGFDIKSFITKHRYRRAYENDYFILFIPPIPSQYETSNYLYTDF